MDGKVWLIVGPSKLAKAKTEAKTARRMDGRPAGLGGKRPAEIGGRQIHPTGDACDVRRHCLGALPRGQCIARSKSSGSDGNEVRN